MTPGPDIGGGMTPGPETGAETAMLCLGAGVACGIESSQPEKKSVDESMGAAAALVPKGELRTRMLPPAPSCMVLMDTL